MSPQLAPLDWNDGLEQAPAEVPWLWPGLLAAGNLTLLTGGWKSGKTTLVSMLLERRRAGGFLLNRAVQPGVTVVVSEEDRNLWTRRRQRLDFGAGVAFWCRPYPCRPTAALWLDLLNRLLELRKERGVDLVVIDPLAMFVPANENHPASLLASLAELQRLTREGLAVLLLHHPAKGEPRLGQAARGSGVLSAVADILLELRVPPGDPATRRRRLFGFSRFEETPRRLSLEWTADSLDYAVFVDAEDDDCFAAALAVLRVLLARAPHPLTRQELLAAWPAPPPEPSTLWRWLNRAFRLDLLRRTGAGTKTDPHHYTLPDPS